MQILLKICYNKNETNVLKNHPDEYLKINTKPPEQAVGGRKPHKPI